MVRTRANGEPLEIDGLRDDLGALVAHGGGKADVHELGRDFSEWGIRQFDDGIQLGARVEHRAAVEAVAGALLDILGKDGGDGYIHLGAAGWWVKDYDDAPRCKGRWVQSETPPLYYAGDELDYRARPRSATK